MLVIDELAALTAYADLEVRREAGRMLAEILTQGRALGVVVVACVQDPRKDVVAMRGLFTQTIALRLRSVEETVMVLGDGMSRVAPAHRISPTHPGTGWVVEDTGAADRVRADYWPDALIRDLSHAVRHRGPPRPVSRRRGRRDEVDRRTARRGRRPQAQGPAQAARTPAARRTGPEADRGVRRTVRHERPRLR